MKCECAILGAYAPCSHCTNPNQCEHCGGQGYHVQYNSYGDPPEQELCDECGGSGERNIKPATSMKTAEDHIAEQYELMLDSIKKPYDPSRPSLMTPDLDAWWHGRKHKVRERIEGTAEQDAVDRVYDRVWTKLEDDFYSDLKSDLRHSVLEMLNDDFVSLAKDALRTAITDKFAKEISDQVKAVVTELALVKKDDVAEHTRNHFNKILNEWQEHLQKELAKMYASRFNESRVSEIIQALEQQVRDHFAKVAEEFIRDSLQAKVKFEPKRKLVLT